MANGLQHVSVFVCGWGQKSDNVLARATEQVATPSVLSQGRRVQLASPAAGSGGHTSLAFAAAAAASTNWSRIWSVASFTCQNAYPARLESRPMQ